MPLTTIQAIDYTSRDAASIRDDSIRAIPLYTPEWTDHNPSDFGIVTLRILAGHLDSLHFYVDRAAGEMFLTTAVKRESVVKILKLINFELRSIVPASVDVEFSLNTPLSIPVLIPEGTIVQTIAFELAAPVLFETTSDLTIPALGLLGVVSVREGEADDEPLGTSNGLANQSFVVQTLIIVERSLEVRVDEGAGFVLWTSVTTFVDSSPTDEHYRIERDAEERITIFFGDNLQGKIPAPTSEVKADFVSISGDRGGAGVFGNVGAGTISIVQSTIFASGLRVTLAVTNPLQASGGEDRQSIEEAKRLGPASLLALNRAVTPTDYKTLIEQQGGVSKAKVIQGTSDDPCCACNLDVFVAPAGGGNLSQVAKDDLLVFLDDKKMVGTCIVIKDPTFLDIDVIGEVFLVATVDSDTTEDSVGTSVVDFFDLEGEFADFGQDVFLGNLFAVMEAIPGVDHVNLSKVTRRPVPVFTNSAADSTFGPVVLGPAQGVDEVWTIVFTSPTTFSVQGSVSGLQTATGTVGTPYSSDTNQIAFEITAGVIPNAIGDTAEFRTSPFLGNVPVEPTEIMQQGSVSLTFIVLAGATGGIVC